MPKKGWTTIFYMATFDHGTDDVLGIICTVHNPTDQRGETGGHRGSCERSVKTDGCFRK